MNNRLALAARAPSPRSSSPPSRSLAAPAARRGDAQLPAQLHRRLQGRRPHRRERRLQRQRARRAQPRLARPPRRRSSVDAARSSSATRCCSAPATTARSSASAGGKYELAATTGAWAVSSLVDGVERRRVRGHLPRRQGVQDARRAEGRRRRGLRHAPRRRGRVGPRLRRQEQGALRGDRARGQALPHRPGGQGAGLLTRARTRNLISVAVADDGTVYAGSSGKALLYKITGPGPRHGALRLRRRRREGHRRRARNGERVRRRQQVQRELRRAQAQQAGPARAAARARRRGPARASDALQPRTASPRQMLEDDDSHYVSLALGDDGQPYVGTARRGAALHRRRQPPRAPRGRDRRAADRRRGRWPARSASWSGAIRSSSTRSRAWAAPTRCGRARCSTPASAPPSAGSPGAPRARSSSPSAAATPPRPTPPGTRGRPPLTAPGLPKMAPGRYTQIRARWARDPRAALREVHLYFVTDNARAIVTSIDASQRGAARR